VLTRRGKVALAAALVLVLAGRILGITELFGVAAALAALVIVAAVRTKLSRARTAVTARLSPEVIQTDQPTVLELFVENAGLSATPPGRLQLLPIGGGRHRILVPRLAPGERAVVAIGLDSSRRGKQGISGYEAVLGDGLGLAAQRLVSTGRIEYLVRPRTEELPHTLPVSIGFLDREGLASAADRIVTGASTLRGYVPGDDLRRIHWPTTARVGDLMVREGGEPDVSNRSGTTIVLGTNRGGGDAFERAVEIAASLAWAAQRDGMVRVMTTGGFDSGPDSGDAHLADISARLATLQATAAPPKDWHRRLEAQGRTAGTVEPPGARSLMDQLLGVGPVHNECSILIAVEGVGRLEDAEFNEQVMAEAPSGVGMVVTILVGGETVRFERLSRRELVVGMPIGRAMHDVWNMALDLPIGEVRELDIGLLPEADMVLEETV
jgi:uncharacterized protein (DUF58 family)